MAVDLCKRGGGTRVATVTVKVTESAVSGSGKLIGVLASLQVKGDCPLAAGEHTVVAKLKEIPDEFINFDGNIAWRIEGSDASVTMNATRAELFFIYATPHHMYKRVGSGRGVD